MRGDPEQGCVRCIIHNNTRMEYLLHYNTTYCSGARLRHCLVTERYHRKYELFSAISIIPYSYDYAYIPGTSMMQFIYLE